MNNQLGFKYRLQMVGMIFLLILAMILFGLLLLVYFIIIFIPMLLSTRMFKLYAYYFITRTKLNNPSPPNTKTT